MSTDAHDEQKRIKLRRHGHSKKKSRNPTVVLTTDGEVHTHEEAQVFVHDLNQFVTVQLLEGTLAVLSPGQLCENHGYSYEWVGGQEPRLTQNGKSIICKTDKSYLLSFQGYLSILEIVRLPQRRQESLGPDAHQVSGSRAA